MEKLLFVGVFGLALSVFVVSFYRMINTPQHYGDPEFDDKSES